MAVRIYSLARDLKIDSKEILEFCKKAGIEGKGSALASLTEEECELLQAAMKKNAAPSEAPEPIKPELAPPDGPDPAQPIQRTDYVPASGVVPAVAGDSSEVKTEEHGKKTIRKKAVPRPKLASAPTMRAPTPSAGPSEPSPQKPDLRLPPDAIRARKAPSKKAPQPEQPVEPQSDEKAGRTQPKPAASGATGREERQRRRGERQPGRHVGLDQAGDDVDRRPLRGQHQVDARRTGLLGDPHDGVLDVAGRGHHQVGELVDDRQDVGVGLVFAVAAQRRGDLAGTHLVVEHVDVPHPGGLHVLIALLHLLDQPGQRRGGLLGQRHGQRARGRHAQIDARGQLVLDEVDVPFLLQRQESFHAAPMAAAPDHQ